MPATRVLVWAIAALLVAAQLAGCARRDQPLDDAARAEFVTQCLRTSVGGGDEAVCGGVFDCLAAHVTPAELQAIADAVADGEEPRAPARAEQARTCMQQVVATNPSALGGYDDPETSIGFQGQCAQELAGMRDADRICGRIYLCLRQTVPFDEFFAYNLASDQAQPVDPSVERRLTKCARRAVAG